MVHRCRDANADAVVPMLVSSASVDNLSSPLAMGGVNRSHSVGQCLTLCFYTCVSVLRASELRHVAAVALWFDSQVFLSALVVCPSFVLPPALPGRVFHVHAVVRIGVTVVPSTMQAVILQVITVFFCLLKGFSCLLTGTGAVANDFGYPRSLKSDESYRLVFTAVRFWRWSWLWTKVDEPRLCIRSIGAFWMKFRVSSSC